METIEAILGASVFALLIGSILLTLSLILAQLPLALFSQQGALVQAVIYVLCTLPTIAITAYMFVHALKVEKELIAERR